MNNHKLWVFVLSIFTVFCTYSLPASSESQQTVKSERGLVIFYRVKRAKGAVLRFQIQDSAKGSIGALENGTMIRHELEPGSYTFTVRSPSVDGSDSITLNVEAGKVYYVKGEILWGWPAGRPKFSRPSDSEAQSDLAAMK